PQQPVHRKVNAGANSYPVRPGEIRSCPARLFFSFLPTRRYHRSCPLSVISPWSLVIGQSTNDQGLMTKDTTNERFCPRAEVPVVRQELSQGTSQLLHRRFRPARSRLRL